MSTPLAPYDRRHAHGAFYLLPTLLLLTLLVLPLSWAQAGTEGGADPTAKPKETTESVAPDFELKDLDGKTYHLSELTKKGPVFIDFWTTWCKPCLQELPELQKLYEKYKDRGFTLVTFASDDQRTVGKVKPMVKSRRFQFPVILDTKREVGNKYNVRQYPTSIMVAPGGKIARVTIGYRPGDEKKIEEEIVALLLEEPAEGDVETETQGQEDGGKN